ncbi:MAG TPA: hypothetical protein VMA95_07890, partial [Streptosporangiaceae bacterium]|nr:hypothetical protein [Streptosporangiaceae bacterium]
LTMAIKIDDNLMTLEIGGAVISEARRRPGGWWEVDFWPRFFDRGRAITALTVTELLETGHGADDPLVVALREELRSPGVLGMTITGNGCCHWPERTRAVLDQPGLSGSGPAVPGVISC